MGDQAPPSAERSHVHVSADTSPSGSETPALSGVPMWGWSEENVDLSGLVEVGEADDDADGGVDYGIRVSAEVLAVEDEDYDRVSGPGLIVQRLLRDELA